MGDRGVKTADIPIRIGPIYATNTVNERVDIHPPGPLVVESKGITYSGLGRVALEWLPSPTVCWSLEDYHPTTPPLWTGEVILKIPGIPNEVRARCAKANMSGGMEAKPPSVSGYVENGEGRKCDVRLKSITFHVPNFIPFIG